MVILTLGAFRFSGLQADVPSLPLNIEAGAIFDAVDSIRKYVFDGGAWNEFVAGTGEINEMANVGVGTGLIFRDKIGVTFNVKSLIGGTNITVTDNADDITISSTGTSPLTTKGDLLTFDTQDVRLPVGTDGQILSANSAVSFGVEWIDDVQEVFTWTANHDMNGFAAEDSKFADGTDPTKILALDLLGMTTAITLTLQSAQSTLQTLLIPNITQADTIATEKFPQTLASKTLDLPIITDFTNATHDHLTTAGGGLLAGVYSGITGIGVQTQTLDMGINLIDNVTRIAVGEIFDETNGVAAITITDFTAAMFFNNRVITGFDFDANGTLNSLVNVEVADLANATAGELITWASGGAPAVVPVGTATDVLTSNGVGQAPTFQPSAGGAGTFQPAYQFAVTDTGNLVADPGVDVANVWRLPDDFTSLSEISCYVEDAPTGQSIIVLVKKNTVTEATLTILAGTTFATTSTFTSGFINAVDEITVEISQVGSGATGSNLKVSIIDGLQSATKSLQFAVTDAGVDIVSGLVNDVWRTPTAITTMTQINAYVQVAPVGQAITLDVFRGVTLIGAITIADGALAGSTVVTDSLATNEEITVNITQAGLTTAGRNLKVNILGT